MNSEILRCSLCKLVDIYQQVLFPFTKRIAFIENEITLTEHSLSEWAPLGAKSYRRVDHCCSRCGLNIHILRHVHEVRLRFVHSNKTYAFAGLPARVRYRPKEK